MTEGEKYIDLLIQMLAIPSLSRKEDTRADFLQKWLLNGRFHTRRFGNNLVISASGNYRKAKILLNSHIDTVPPGEGWNSDPYLPKVQENTITAVGSNDAGASVVALLGAYTAFLDHEKTEDLVLVLSAEEEVSGKNGLESVLSELKSLKFAVVGEPTQMKAAIAERGLMVVDAVSKGKSGHAAREEGVNAIYKALEDINKIRSLAFHEHSRWLKDPSVSVTMISAGKSHNVIPAKCDFVIDVRSNDKYSNEKILEILKSKCKAELKPRSLRLKSSYLSDSHPVMNIVSNLDLKPFGSPTLSDMALLRIPSVKIGPGDSARSHTANEYILKDEIREGIAIYQNLISELLKIEL